MQERHVTPDKHPAHNIIAQVPTALDAIGHCGSWDKARLRQVRLIELGNLAFVLISSPTQAGHDLHLGIGASHGE